MMSYRSVRWTLRQAIMLMAAAFSQVSAMTLREAVDYAMEHNRDILGIVEQTHQRKAQVTEARADAFPQVNLLVNSFRVRDPGFLNSTFGQQLLKGGTDAGSEIPIPLEAILPRPQTFYDMTMSFQQPLYTWGKVSNAIKLADLGIQEVERLLEDTRQNVAYQVIAAYYDMLLAEETVKVYEKSIEVQQRYLKMTRDYLEVGDATRLDLLRSESSLAATEPQLLQAVNRVVLARKKLNFLLGRPLDTEVLTATVEAEEFSPAPGLDSVLAVALANRPDLQRLNLQVRMYEKTVKVVHADFRPRVDLTGHYGFSTIKTDDLFDRNFESWRVSLEVKVPIFDGLRNRGQVNQYRSQQSQKEIESETLAERIRLEARQSIDSHNTAIEIYKASRTALESAEEEERVTADSYEQGLATSYELLEANRKVRQAQTDYLNARYGCFLQQASLKRVMGIPVGELF